MTNKEFYSEKLLAAMEDVDHKAEECNWTVHEIQEVWR